MTSQTCGLLALPAELRNQIFAYAVVEELPMQARIETITQRQPSWTASRKQHLWCRLRRRIGSASSNSIDHQMNISAAETLPPGRFSHAYPDRPALARVNRQCHDEVLPIFFGPNDFFFELADVLDPGIDRWWKLMDGAGSTQARASSESGAHAPFSGSRHNRGTRVSYSRSI